MANFIRCLVVSVFTVALSSFTVADFVPPSADPEAKDYTALPDGYTQVEYVQSTREQYIDTEYVPNANTKIDVTFSVVEYNEGSGYKGANIFGCYGGNNAGRCQFRYGQPLFVGWGASYDNTSYKQYQLDTAKHTLVLDKGSFSIDGGSPVYSQSWSGTSVNLLLFGINPNGGTLNPALYSMVRIYSLIISENGVEKRHYIPAKEKNAEGNVGLYDTVNGVFYQSETSTALVAGPTVGPVNDDPKFSGFSVGSDPNRAWEQVTVADGAEYDATVEAYMGTDTATWTAISNWTHSVESATYAATNSEVSIGATYYCAFKLTYEKDNETIVKWTSTNSTTISGTVHWSGKGADTKWTTAGNWQEGLVPNAALTTHFAKGSLIYVTAGEEALASKSVYVTQGTTVWDFQPETTLAMTHLHLGEKDKTTATLIVTNGVINATGSIAFDNSNSTLCLSGTKAVFAEKSYPTSVGNNTIKLTDGASLKLPACQAAGNAMGGDTFYVGEGSSLVITGGDGNSTPSTIPKNSTITIDGGAWTNYNQFSISTVANGTNKIIVRNGGVFAHRTSSKLSATKKPLSLGGRGHTYVTVTDGGLFEDLNELRFGDGADNYAGDSEIAITNGTLKCAGAITIGRDRRCKANYMVTVAGADGILDAKGSLTLGATTNAGATNRDKGSATLLVDGGTVKVGSALNIGAQYESVQDTLKVMGATAKITAGSVVCTTNAVIKFVVPESGFANGFDDGSLITVANDITMASESPTPISIDATDCTSSGWQTLFRSTDGEINNLTTDQISVTASRGYELKLEKGEGDKVTALKFRLTSSASRGIIIIYR